MERPGCTRFYAHWDDEPHPLTPFLSPSGVRVWQKFERLGPLRTRTSAVRSAKGLSNRAKRLECARLAGALASSSFVVRAGKSGSKLHALQTLRDNSCLIVPSKPAVAHGRRPWSSGCLGAGRQVASAPK